MRRILFLLPLTLSLIACGPSHPGTLTYRVLLSGSDVTGSTIAEDVHVAPDDAQWRTFLTQAQTALEKAPSHFAVTGVSIQLDATRSRNVGALQDVFVGNVTAFLRASDTGTQVDIAEVTDPKGSAQVKMASLGTSLETLDPSLVRSDFRLGLRGGTQRSPGGDFDAALIVTLDVTAR